MMNLQHNIDQQVGLFVRNVSELVRKAAIEALQQAIIVPGVDATAGSALEPKKGRRPAKSKAKRLARKPAPPQDTAELSALRDRLYEAVASHPGERMEPIAQVLGRTPSALRTSIRALVKDGRVSKVGKGRATRYFPMGADAPATMTQ